MTVFQFIAAIFFLYIAISCYFTLRGLELSKGLRSFAFQWTAFIAFFWQCLISLPPGSSGSYEEAAVFGFLALVFLWANVRTFRRYQAKCHAALASENAEQKGNL